MRPQPAQPTLSIPAPCPAPHAARLHPFSSPLTSRSARILADHRLACGSHFTPVPHPAVLQRHIRVQNEVNRHWGLSKSRKDASPLKRDTGMLCSLLVPDGRHSIPHSAALPLSCSHATPRGGHCKTRLGYQNTLVDILEPELDHRPPPPLHRYFNTGPGFIFEHLISTSVQEGGCTTPQQTALR